MNKKVIGIIVPLVMVLAAVSACAAPISTPNTTAPVNNTPASPGATAPATGIPTIAPTPPTQQGGAGVSNGIAVAPAEASPNVAIAAQGGGYTSPSPVLNQYQGQNSGIVVTGQGQITATPDLAYLSLGVNAQSATVAQAQTDANTAMTAVMQVLKNKGIADVDITTTGININPIYNYSNNTNTITGYQVSNTITVTVRKIGDASSIIDASVAAGGNFIRVNSISFGVSDPTPYTKQARAAAMANAKDTAGQLATLGGVKLGSPVYITESSGYYPPSPVYYANGAASAKDIATPISPGQTQISVSVTVIYSMQ
jgi:uncharacterized protein YggE